MQRKSSSFGNFLRKVAGVKIFKESIKTSLDELVQRALIALYLKDVSKFGNPPKKNKFWSRVVTHIDARTAQRLVNTKLVVGRAIKSGIPSELQLTVKGATTVKKVIGV